MFMLNKHRKTSPLQNYKHKSSSKAKTHVTKVGKDQAEAKLMGRSGLAINRQSNRQEKAHSGNCVSEEELQQSDTGTENTGRLNRGATGEQHQADW